MIVETGTGVQGANSYNALNDASAYFADRGLTDWADATAVEQSAALIMATDYFELTYHAKSAPLVKDQGLQFPSRDPTALAVVRRATLTLALEALSVSLLKRIEREAKRVEQRLDGVGLLLTDYDPDPIVDHYPHITAMVRDYAVRRAAGVNAGRVTREVPFGIGPVNATDRAWFDVSNGFPGNGWGVFGGWDYTR